MPHSVRGSPYQKPTSDSWKGYRVGIPNRDGVREYLSCLCLPVSLFGLVKTYPSRRGTGNEFLRTDSTITGQTRTKGRGHWDSILQTLNSPLRGESGRYSGAPTCHVHPLCTPHSFSQPLFATIELSSEVSFAARSSTSRANSNVGEPGGRVTTAVGSARIAAAAAVMPSRRMSFAST